MNFYMCLRWWSFVSLAAISFLVDFKVKLGLELVIFPSLTSTHSRSGWNLKIHSKREGTKPPSFKAHVKIKIVSYHMGPLKLASSYCVRLGLHCSVLIKRMSFWETQHSCLKFGPMVLGGPPQKNLVPHMCLTSRRLVPEIGPSILGIQYKR